MRAVDGKEEGIDYKCSGLKLAREDAAGKRWLTIPRQDSRRPHNVISLLRHGELRVCWEVQ